jgi:hypothetical protein
MFQVYDLAIAWNWEYDDTFVKLLDRACRACELSLLQITEDNLETIVEQVRRGELAFRLLLDRASDTDEAFYPLADWGRAGGAHILNPRALAHRAWDKAAMHFEFISAGLHTPHTIVLPPYDERPEMEAPDLSALGEKMILKPAHGGGGASVAVMHAQDSWRAIQHVRRNVADDKFLIQDWVTPRQSLAGAAWFRVLYALGEVLPFWWDVHTHVYRTVTREQVQRLELSPLYEIAHAIARVCRLDIFSTEIAQRAGDGQFVSVDYVNDPIDLRLQSTAVDGVPDSAVRVIAECIAESAASRRMFSRTGR